MNLWKLPEESLAGDLSIAPGMGLRHRRLHGGVRDGVDLIEMENGRLKISAIPTRGMGIWQVASTRYPQRTLGWKSPVRGPVHPKFVPLHDPSGLGWLDGFDEWLCRCGLQSNGAPEFTDTGTLIYPLHGLIANRPAYDVQWSFDDASGQAKLTGCVDETRFHFQKLRLTSTISTRVDSSSFQIHDIVENYSAVAAHIQLLYHINFGSPLLGAGSLLRAAIQRIVPRTQADVPHIDQWAHYGHPAAGRAESVFFCQLLADEQGQTCTLLTDPEREWGVSLRYPVEALPCFTLWKNLVAPDDGYVTGLEPGTNYPNRHSFERAHGRAPCLQPGERRVFTLTIELHESPEEIRDVEQRIDKLQSLKKMDVVRSPHPDWCA